MPLVEIVTRPITGAGSWHPERDAHLWVKFCLRAHHMQAQTVARRFDEAQVVGEHLLTLVTEHGLPERTLDPLFEAAMGLRVRRPGYVRRSGVEERTASRDLAALAQAGLLEAQGNTRGRYYTAAGRIRDVATESRRRRPRLTDPYPELLDQIGAGVRALQSEVADGTTARSGMPGERTRTRHTWSGV